MSGQPQSRVTKSSPMKATIPISSVFKSSIRKNHSPQLSPTYWKPRTTSDSGIRSPGSSTVYKAEKSKTLGNGLTGGSSIRRTASLDTIYLKGHWPRDGHYYTGFLLIDKATQTEDYDWTDTRKIHCIAENEDKLEKMIIKQRLQRSNNQQTGGSRTGTSPSKSPVTADHTLTTSSQTNTSCIMQPLPRANPVNIPLKPVPKQTMRSSVEGLNQEIERLVLKSGKSDLPYSERTDDNKFCQVTPEGHRAPLPVMCSVNTQTPSANDIMGSCQSLSGSVGSSPEHEGPNKLGTSPRMFMARGPPDGCEKVPLRTSDERRSIALDATSSPQQAPPCSFQLRPSLGSAFQLLQPQHLVDENPASADDRRDLPFVPPARQDLG